MDWLVRLQKEFEELEERRGALVMFIHGEEEGWQKLHIDDKNLLWIQ